MARSSMDARGRAPTWPLRLRSLFRFSLFGFCLFLVALVVHAATSYVYDANGRLVAVSKDDGSSAQYTYDAMGNLAQVSGVPAGQLTLFAFTPTHGTVGTPVTLYGRGFDTTAANDHVSFNGTVAPVTSATASQLQAQVPAGAGSGPITVSVGNQTVSSSQPFVVDDTGLPPVITQTTPLVSPGGTVVVDGAYLYPVPNTTSVRMSGSYVVPTSIGNSELRYQVSSTARSGHVSVDTPFGSATSANPVTVLPSNLTAASNGTATYLPTNGPGVGVNTSVAGQTVVLSFDAPAKGNVELTLNGIYIQGSSGTSISVQVFDPSGQSVMTYQCSKSNPGASCRLPLWNLAGGSYAAIVSPPDATSLMGFNAILRTDTIGPALVANVPATINLVAGDVQRLTFGARAGDTVALRLSNVSTSPAGQSMYVQVYAPGVIPTATNYYTIFNTSTNATVNLASLPKDGTYTAIVSIVPGTPGSAQLTLGAGVQGVVQNDGVARHFQNGIPGQNVYLKFTAQQGDNLELTLNNLQAPSGSMPVQVYTSSGANVASQNCTSAGVGSCRLALWNLPADTYSVVVSPGDTNSMVGFDVLLKPDVIGPELAASAPVSVSLAAGDVQWLTFKANAGDTVALQLSGVKTTPSGLPMYVQVYAPGTVPSATNYYTIFNARDIATVNLQNLPVSGTYTVVVSIIPGIPGSAQLTLARGVLGSLTEDGSVQSYQGGISGQNVYLTFSAHQGENLELTLNNIRGTVSGSAVSVGVFTASGANVAGQSCSASGAASCRFALWNMSEGVYQVIVSPDADNRVSFDVLLKPDVIGPALTPGTAATVNLSAGDVQRLSFDAVAGDAVTLRLSGVSTTPAGQQMYVQVYKPGTVPTANNYYAIFSTQSTATVNLANLPVSGTYVAVVSIVSGAPGSGQLALGSPVKGTLSSDGSIQAFQTNIGGQSVYLKFQANQGDNLELTLNNLHGTTSSSLTLDVIDANGARIASQGCSTSGVASCRQQLANLTGGTYGAVVSTSDANNVIAFNATLKPEVIGPALVPNVPVSVNLSAGDVERLTFDANAGENITLQLSNVATVPAGQQMYVQVYKPGVVPTSNNFYAIFYTTSSIAYGMQNLPASGTYTAIVSIIPGTPGSATLMLSK